MDLAEWIASGGEILAPLRDPQVFTRPRVAEHGTAVEWGSDDDLAIDAVHLDQLAAQQAEGLRRQQRQAR